MIGQGREAISKVSREMIFAALQEQLRSFQEAQQQTAEVPPAAKGQLH